MSIRRPVWAVIPIKDTRHAKQRLAERFSAAERQQLALAMIEDVLDAVTAVRELAGVIVVTVDPVAAELATRRGAIVSDVGALDGHTGAVMATARRLGAEGQAILTVPADIPLVSASDISALVASRGTDPSFTIVPARDFQGSNAVLVSPADAVTLRFGENSFYPHLAAAEAAGIKPGIFRCSSIELDIDTPDDLATFAKTASATRASAFAAQLMRTSTADMKATKT